jgi:hypothetical protein
MLTDYIKIQVAMEDYELAIKQDIVYDEAVEQALKTIELSKTNTIMAYQTLMISKADVEQLGSQINKALAKANDSKYYELLSVSGQLNQTFNLSKI